MLFQIMFVKWEVYMKKSVFALADSESHANRVVDHLRSAGYGDEISVLFSDSAGYTTKGTVNPTRDTVNPNTPSKPNVVTGKKGSIVHENTTKAPEGAAIGALSGGIVGGTLGLLAGIGALSIPGAGPFIAAGPLMAAFAGSALGGSTFMLAGALIGLGVPEFEAKRYEGSLKKGSVLISVHTDTSDQQNEVIQILKRDNAKDISTTMEKVAKS